MDCMKRDIVIHVDPRFAAYAMVMTTLSFRSLVDFIETESGIRFPQLDIDQMQEALEDLFEGCSRHIDPSDIDKYMKVLVNLEKKTSGPFGSIFLSLCALVPRCRSTLRCVYGARLCRSADNRPKQDKGLCRKRG